MDVIKAYRKKTHPADLELSQQWEEAEISDTITTFDLSPSRLPILIVHKIKEIVIALEGNGSRPSHRGGGYSMDGKSFTLNTVDRHSVCYAVENHPMDSRVKLKDDGICETLNARCGTGGGNVPLVLVLTSDNRNLQTDGSFRNAESK